jgi:hypothetical protein
MIVMLAVLGMLTSRAADPRTWKWLVTEPKTESRAGDVAESEPETISPGPTDLHLEERAAAAEQFQAISDRTIELSREEMPAYWRLFSWASHQSLDELQRRASQALVFNQFVQTPDEQRGKLFRLDLNVRRVLSYDAPPNSAGIAKVYEVWGWTTESKAWLYVVLTAQLPPRMPVGPDVNERATFAGYFFKVQGYHAAGAGPRDQLIPAPLFIGRLDWKPAPASAQAHDDLWWLFVLGGIAASYGITRLALWYFSSNRHSMRPTSAHSDGSPKNNSLLDWLAKAEQGPTADGGRHPPPFLDN